MGENPFVWESRNVKGEVVGRIEVEGDGYGAYIIVNGKYLAMVDMYEMQCLDPERRYPQLVIYTGNDDDDPLMHIQWANDGKVTAQVYAGPDGMRHELNREERQHELTFPMEE